MKIEPVHWQQLAQHLDNPGDPALEQEVRQWRAASPENEATFLQLQQVWHLTPDLKILDQLNIQAATERLQATLPEEMVYELPQRRYKWFRVAAIGIPVIVAASWLYSTNSVTYTEKSTLAGNIDSVQLPDNSRVYLDKDSRIRYPDKMDKNRTVFMEQGTAFFEVTNEAANPFVVKLAHSSITVLGTSFNIQLKENSVGVTVKSGKIRFAAGENRQHEMILTAGEGMEYTPATGTLQAFNAINNNEDAWITHELVFVDASLSEVCKKLESLYQVKITLEGKIPLKKLNATFKDNKLGEVLEILQATYPVSVVQHNNNIIITGR
ncbi:FecR domain-containing protein [Chitinophaga sp. MM2321]|uniref:FecR family protein n=1 Tax=Chitinophaga sp. MM2321 TaxID=3137178 RepID=UPI0032D5A4C3